MGEFTSWKAGNKLILENGLVWRVTKKSNGYKRMPNSMVTIKQGSFGTHRATAECLNAAAKIPVY